MPWADLEDALAPTLPPDPVGVGCPSLPVRLMAGLLHLKHAYDVSDEEVCVRWLENPYWQFFTGEVVFQTTLPCNPSSLTRWRQRLGEAGMEELLAQTIAAARTMKAIDARELSRVIVDTGAGEGHRASDRQPVAGGGPQETGAVEPSSRDPAAPDLRAGSGRSGP